MVVRVVITSGRGWECLLLREAQSEPFIGPDTLYVLDLSESLTEPTYTVSGLFTEHCACHCVHVIASQPEGKKSELAPVLDKCITGVLQALHGWFVVIKSNLSF